MSYAIWLVPVGLVMGLVGLIAFLWSMKSGQLEDLDGAAERVLIGEKADRPLPSHIDNDAPEFSTVKGHQP
ncbi:MULTISPECIES: cbb3-type cytochrome oxidase assembly protein CcoS [unclassified Aminobacter]|uniref:cbb3-type cytochrome oxidase assembly protein CcoS n=1 Tax=unclassified Aminobacter TaxID=2644704 RepID=UPI0004653EF7|nr:MULTISPECIES: cbb3-type cytochrome oxidase assembly protein CcoS [unclassified Aminobacter]TWG49993.1 cbb3-type cytochrome oxidase maturation protein [Aminobacter sp. J44]TWH30173.1 cbb3-type cytochrome oxidase maturation protein [Aminobacter sp. J15]